MIMIIKRRGEGGGRAREVRNSCSILRRGDSKSVKRIFYNPIKLRASSKQHWRLNAQEITGPLSIIFSKKMDKYVQFLNYSAWRIQI